MAADAAWAAASVGVAGIAMTWGIVTAAISRTKVSKEDCDEKHRTTDECVNGMRETTARLDERVKTLFTLQEAQSKLIDRQSQVVDRIEEIVRKNGGR